MMLQVSCCDDYWDEYADEVELTVDDELRDIVRPAKIWLAGRSEYESVTVWDGGFEWGCRVECEIMHISAGAVYWTAYVKHTTIELCTETVPTKEICG